MLQLIHPKININIPIFKIKIAPKITLKNFRSKSKSTVNGQLLTSLGLNRFGLNTSPKSNLNPKFFFFLFLFFEQKLQLACLPLVWCKVVPFQCLNRSTTPFFFVSLCEGLARLAGWSALTTIFAMMVIAATDAGHKTSILKKSNFPKPNF